MQYREQSATSWNDIFPGGLGEGGQRAWSRKHNHSSAANNIYTLRSNPK